MIRNLLLSVPVMMVLQACGQDHGYLYQAKDVQVNDSLGHIDEFELSKSSYKDALWFMGCDATDHAPVAQPGQIVLNGLNIDAVRENFQGTKMVFQGRVCPPATYARDVVFMVDVSGSMWYPDADPVVNNSCNRLINLESMIAGLPAGSQFGVVAFEEIIAAASTKYYDNKAALYAELTQNGAKPIADIICGASGISLFDVGLNAAKDLMLRGRGGQVQKELVLLTDGNSEGSTSHNTAALNIAKDLRLTGINVGGANFKVQIAGLRVAPAQVDSFLQASVSADINGVAMVDSINQSAAVSQRLNTLTFGILDTAKISYGPTGSTNSILINLKPILASDFTFNVANGPLVLDRGQTGYDATISYADTRGNTKSVTAKMSWVPAP
jgi:von Willebrand factor type A domain